MKHDFTKIANDMHRAHVMGIPYRLPSMTMRQLTALIAALDAQEISAQLH